MIARMNQVTVVGRKSAARELLQSLQSLGVVQIDPLPPAEGRSLVRLELAGDERDEAERWHTVVGRIEALQRTLDVEDAPAKPRSEAPSSLGDLESYVADLGTQVDQIVAERSDARDEHEVVQTYLPVFRLLAPTLGQLKDSRYLHGTAFLIGQDGVDEVRAKLEDALEDRILVTARPYGRDRLVVAVTLKNDAEALSRALAQAGVSPLTLPGRYRDLETSKAVHVMEERSQTLPKRIAALENELRELAQQHSGKLQAAHAVAQNHAERFDRMRDMLSGRYSFALQGWVPEADTAKVVEGLKKQFGADVAVATRNADEHHDHGVPVKLENPGWMAPFQGLLALFAPPKYGNFDPTWTLAVFFPLFFGLVVGDIAYGLIFLAIGLWLRSRGKQGKNLDLGPLGIVIPSRNLPGIGAVINWCAAWTIVFGIIYGEFVGNFLEKWPKGQPVFYPGDKGIFEILLFRVEVFTPLLILTLGFGVLQVLLGWAVRAYYGWKHHDSKHLWEGIGMFSGLVAVVLYATAFLQGFLGAPVYLVSAVLMVVFLAGVVLSGIPLMVVELISNSGHILSYLRLFAVGLSAALVANLGTNAGFAVNAAIAVPVLGELLGIIVGLTINLAAVLLTIVGHTLQPLRLQYVEFFTKFGFYEQSGRPYKPFRLFGGKA